VVSFFFSVAVVWLNDIAVSWGRMGTQRVILESVEQIAYGMLQTRGSYGNERFSVNVAGLEDERLLRPMITLRLSDDEPPMVFAAAEAVLRCDPGGHQLRVYLTDGEMNYGDTHGVFPDTVVLDVPLWAAAGKDHGSSRPSDTALRDIPREVKKEQTEIRRLEQALASQATCQMVLGDFAALTDPQWKQQHLELHGRRTRLVRLHTEPWRRWANGFSCLAFVLVGAPLAVRLRNGDVWTSFAICFLPVLGVYYPLLAYGVKIAKSGELPPYCVWVGNILFLAAGLLLVRSVVRR
jgi:lipopolysaccharide export system permease protein